MRPVAVERAREAACPLPAQGPGNLYLMRDPKGRTGRAAGDGRAGQDLDFLSCYRILTFRPL